MFDSGSLVSGSYSLRKRNYIYNANELIIIVVSIKLWATKTCLITTSYILDFFLICSFNLSVYETLRQLLIHQNKYFLQNVWKWVLSKKNVPPILQIWLKIKNYSGKNIKNYQSVKNLFRKNVDLSQTPWKLQKALAKFKAKNK